MSDAEETIIQTESAPSDEGWEWAVIEVFGHRSHAGRVREVEKFGAKFVRVDVPVLILFEDDAKAPGHVDHWETRLYGGSSIFSISYTDEASVMKANRPYVSPYRITARSDLDARDSAPGDDDPEMPF